MGKIADASSTKAKELKKLKKKLKPVDDAIAAAAAAGGGSSGSGSSGDATVDAVALFQSVAARYPQHPKREDKVSLRAMIAGMGQHLPCGAGCKSDFQQALRSPIRSGQADESAHVKKLTRRLAPVMALLDEIKTLKKAAKEAAKEAAKKE